jgi:hypothetical protein
MQTLQRQKIFNSPPWTDFKNEPGFRLLETTQALKD